MKANNIVAVAWRDTKRLTTWSTVHLDNTIGKKIQSQDGGAKEVAKPVLVESYNQHMSGVDIIDQISRTSLHKEKHNFNMKMFKFWLWCQRLCLWYHEWLKADYKPDSSFIHPSCQAECQVPGVLVNVSVFDFVSRTWLVVDRTRPKCGT